MRRLAPMLAFLAALPALGADWSGWLDGMPRTCLREEWQPLCQRPCEYVGFSFTGPREELEAMKAAGASIVGLGAMWTPTEDESAPYGCGAPSVTGSGLLGQSFTAERPFDAVAPCLPTGFSTDSGCKWRLLAEGSGAVLAEGKWERVRDNSWPEAVFPEQPAGRYMVEIREPEGSWIGWWGRSDNPYAEGMAVVGGRPQPGTDFELRIREGGVWREVVAAAPAHTSFLLGPAGTSILGELGLHCNFSVGDWNNPGFPYYPDWFNERFPETLALDQNGNRFVGGMFDKLVPAPGIESPVIVDGVSRHIRQVVSSLRDEDPLLYWVMGGEAMYATYGQWSRWSDYGELPVKHFRAWLEQKYGSVAELDAAWGVGCGSFGEVEPPRTQEVSRRWLDWLDFRFAAMAERFCWHYRAARSEDPVRPVVTCNHGTLYQELSYAALGARPELFAAASDGFETGQIMSDGDSELYNILYMETLTGLGKPYCPARLACRKSDPKARGGGTSYTPEAARRYVYETLGGDAWHLGLIQWSGSLPDGEWGVVGTPGEKAIAEVYGELRRLEPVLEDMHAVKPKLGVFLSHATWALKGFLPEWHALNKAAVESHVPKAYVYDEQVKSGQLDDFGVVLSLGNSLVEPEVAAGLERFVARGGRLVIAGAFGDEAVPGIPTADGRAGLARCERVAGTDAWDILARLGPEVTPLSVTSEGSVTRPVEEDVALGRDDWPQDMREAESLGQSLTVPRPGLWKLAIRTPTYCTVPEYGFRLEVLAGGPGGAVLAAKAIPAGVADNSLQEIELPQTAEVGARLYVRAVADERLPQTNLGWWSTRSDCYAGGEAYVGDKAVMGDRQMRLYYRAPVNAARVVEAFVLTDGVSFGVVAVNTSDSEVPARVNLGRLVWGAPPGEYEVSTPLEPGQWSGGLDGQVRLAPHGTASIHVQRVVAEAEARVLVGQAERAQARWGELGAMTPFVQYAYDKAQAQLAEGRWEKAAAMALKVLGQMGLRRRVEATAEGGLSAEAWCYDAAGNPVRPEAALCELTPTQAFWREPRIDADGRVSLALSRDEMPRQWDYAAGRFVAQSGPLRVRLFAQSGSRRAQVLEDVLVR